MSERDAAPPPLEIRLFGPFDVKVEGQPLRRLGSRKRQWLLALLALRHNREVQRSWLAGTLWPESMEQQALANLRQSLADLRRALGAQAERLRSPTTHTVCLDLSGARVDLLEFDEALTRGDAPSLVEAIRIYRGPLLEGCPEEWVLQEREMREQSYLQVLETRARYDLTHGDAAAAIRYLRLAISVDPLRETAQRALMQALAESGDFAAASLVYRELRSLLHREMNVEPAPETTDLFQQLRSETRRHAQTPSPRRPAPTQPSSRSPQTLPPANSGAADQQPLLPSDCLVVQHNLPVQVTSFIGRETEITDVRRLLADTRLLTLTGSGGVGKTRLALQVTAELLQEYPDGAWLVELATLADSSLVPQAVAAVLGIHEEPGRRLITILCDHLKPKRMLLVLDNCEHLVSGCAQLADTLIHACANITILASSRERMGISGELTYRVPSLSLPDYENALTVEHLRQSEAVRLLVDRAVFSQPQFTLTSKNVAAVAHICHLLDGIPLAIELAAARVRVMSVEQIAARLKDRFGLLTGGSRTALPRQQTLRALIDWSYDLLSSAEQLLLARLAVFAGGFTLEAAETICGGDGFRGGDVLEAFTCLVDKSLVMVDDRAEGAVRFRLLETVRQYAHERLNESGDYNRMRRQHGVFYLAMAEEIQPKLQGPEQRLSMDCLEMEHDNLRAGLDFFLEKEDGAEYGLWLTGCLWRFWVVRGYWSAGWEHLRSALSRNGAQVRTAKRANALNGAGVLASRQGDFVSARDCHEESLAIKRELGDKPGIAGSLHNLGNVVFDQGDYAGAQVLFSDALVINRETRNREWAALNLNSLGNVALRRHDYALARTFYEESLAMQRELKNRMGVADSLSNLGLVAEHQGEHGLARSLHEESLLMQRELGNKPGIATALSNLGIVALRQHDYALAHSLMAESLAIKRDLGHKQGIAFSLASLGDVAAGQQLWERAIRLWGATETLQEAIGAVLWSDQWGLHDQDMAKARSALGEDACIAVYTDGQAMTLDQAIDYALHDEATQ